MSSPPTSPADSSALRLRLVCLGLFLGTLLLFSRAFHFGFIDYDDPDFVTENVHVQTGLTWDNLRWAFTSGGNAANWQPLTWLSLMLDAQVYGLNPGAFHAVNIFWHALNAVLAFVALRRLTGAFGASALCAALFAWHPLRVESVAWISERKDVLSVFFALLTLWGYGHYADQRRLGRLAEARRSYVLTLMAFAAGLLCKAMLVTLPCLLLLLDGWPLRRILFNRPAPSLRKLLVEKLPFFALSAGSCVVTYTVQKSGGALSSEFPLGMRLGNAVVSVARYLGKFAWPFDLAVCYSPQHWTALPVIGATFLVVVISGLAISQWSRRPWLLTGWCWFLGLLVPVIGLVQSGPQAMADRYSYLPILGVEIALIWTLREWTLPSALRWLKGGLAALILLGVSARTWNQLGVWRNSETLFTHALAVTSDNYLAHCNLATTFLNQGRLDEAEDHCRHALAIAPDYAPAYYRLGAVLEKMGHAEAAIAQYREAVQRQPSLAPAQFRLGGLLLQQGKLAQAETHFRRAFQSQPDFAPPYHGLALTLAREHREPEANAAFEQALHLQPKDASTHNDFANALVAQHRIDEAMRHYEHAIQSDPAFAKASFNYANLLRDQGQPMAASVHYRRAIALAPQDADARYGLGVALEQLERGDEAMESYQAALRLSPTHAEAHYNIGAILFNRGQLAEAREHFNAALRSRPTFAEAARGVQLVAEQLRERPVTIDSNPKADASAIDNRGAH